MPIYPIDYKIEAATANEAKEKMTALTVLAVKLTTKELLKLADIIENNPKTTKMAKKYLGL